MECKKFTQGVNGVSGSLDAYKIDLKKLIKTYSKNIHDIFNQGLQRYGDSFNDTVQFRKKQQYIEIMTTHCLDFARLFPTFDPDLYPIGSSGINLQKQEGFFLLFYLYVNLMLFQLILQNGLIIIMVYYQIQIREY